MKRTTKQHYLRFLRRFSLVLITIFVSEVTFVYAGPAYAVELISFTASGISGGVELRWETATELGASAFLLQRAQGGSFQDLTQLVDENGQPYPGGVIEAEGSPTFGAIYIARDLTAVPGQAYAYQLLEVESDNNITVIASATVLAGATPSPTQIIIGGNNTPQPGTQNTSTPTVLATAVPTIPPATVPPTSTPARTLITATPATDDEQSATPVTVPLTPVNSLNNSNGDSGNTSASQPVVSAPTDSGITQVAQVTPESGYPGPTAVPETESGYPEAVVTPLTIETTETPYPANALIQEQQPTPTIIGVIGSQPDNSSNTSSATNAAQIPPSTSSTGILWLGFLGGLLIFGAAVAGSIALFIRRRQ